MWAQSFRDANSSAIYYLMTPGDFSALHRLSSPELWHHYCGAPVQMLLLKPSGLAEHPVLGPDLAAGQRPVVVVETGVWMAAETTGEWSLVGTTMAPPFDHQGFELADAGELICQYPDAITDIERLTRTTVKTP